MTGQVFIHELMKVSFNLRQPKSERPTNIYMVVRIDKKQIKLATGVKVYPDQWNIRKQKAYISCRLTELDNQNNTIVNEKISELEKQFEEFKSYLCDNPDEIENCWELLKKYIYKDRYMEKAKKINAVFWLRDAIAKDKTIKDSGNRKGASTKEIYIGQLESFQEFLKDTGKWPISFEDISLGLIKDYETYLFNRTVRGKKTTSTRTVANKCTQLIGIIKRAEPYDLIDIREAKLDRYVKPQTRQGDENEISLSQEEIDRIYSLALTGNEEISRDLFILLYWTGQRFSDLYLLDKGVIKEADGGKILELVQTKRTHRVSIPLLPVALEILEKYKYNLPKISENTMLRWIKKIGLKAGITEDHTVIEDRGGEITTTIKKRWELITPHTARRSYVNNMLTEGYDSHLIKKITGHTTESAFKRYVKVKGEDVARMVLKKESEKVQEKVSEPNKTVKIPSLETGSLMNPNQILKMIKDGIAEGLKPLDHKLSDLKDVVTHITRHKRSLYSSNIHNIVNMVVSLKKNNTPQSVIIEMLDSSGILSVSFSDVMTCNQFFLKPDDFHPAGERLFKKIDRIIESKEKKDKS